MSDRAPQSQSSEQETPPGLAGTVLRGAGYGGLGFGLSQAMTLGVYIVLARLMDPSEFGDFAAATVLIGFTLLVTETGMMSAIVQRRDRLDEAASTATVATFAAGIAFSLLLLAFSPLVGAFFDSDRVGAIAAATSGIIFLRTVVAVPDALLWRRFSFARRLVIEPAQVLAFGTASIVAAANDLGPWALVAGQYASHGLELILVWTLARWRPKLSLASFAMWRDLVGYGRHVFFATTILRAGEQSDAVIVGKLLGTALLGQFRYAFRVASTPFLLLVAAASFALFPAFARIAHDRERLRAAFLRSLRWMMALAAPGGLILVPLGVPIMVLVFGDVWEPAGYAVMALCAYAIGGAITSLVSELIKSQDRPASLTPMHTTTAVTSVGAMAALAPLGLSAAAAGLSIGACAGGVYGIRVAQRVTGLPARLLFDAITRPICAAAIMAATVLALDRLVLDAAERGTAAGLALVLAEGLVAAIVYAAALRMLAPETARELSRGLADGLAAVLRRLRSRPPEGGSGGPATA